MDTRDMRQEYGQGGARAALAEADFAADPLEQFQAWFDEAERSGQVKEPNAMTLATVGEDGQPHARVVLLKEVDEAGLVFYTNHDSAKASQIEGEARVALVFFWDHLERQVRVTGRAHCVPREQTRAYFATRPRASQLGAWASRQSEVIPDRAALERRLAELEKQYEGRDVPAPPHWGGYVVRPTTMEFWQGRRSRLHDRLRYRRGAGGAWLLERLSP